MDARRAPERVGFAHLPDQIPEFRVGLPPPRFPALPRPVSPEAATVPGDDRLGLHNHEHALPARPELREDDPERSVDCPQARFRARPLQDLDLLAQSGDFKGQL